MPGLLPPGYKKGRSWLYRLARIMGNVQPWLELSPRRIIRRIVHRYLGRIFSQQVFGGGFLPKLLRKILGLGRGR